MKFIFFNGPSGSGKDYACKYLTEHLECQQGMVIHDKFSGPLKYMVARAIGKPYHELEKAKDTTTYFGKTYRQHQMEFFQYLSENFGEDVLGRMLGADWLRVRDSGTESTLILCSDGGLGPEVSYVCTLFGYDNCHIIQLSRDGKEFNDYRRYIEIPGVTTTHIHNDGTFHFLDRVEQVVRKWLNLNEGT